MGIMERLFRATHGTSGTKPRTRSSDYEVGGEGYGEVPKRNQVFEAAVLQVRFVTTDERLVVERWYERRMPESGRVSSRHQAYDFSEIAGSRMG